MIKKIILLFVIQCFIMSMFAQNAENYDFSVSGEKMTLNVQKKGMEVKFPKMEEKGKFAKFFKTKWCPPNPDMETLYLGPFNPELISGKQDFWKCYHYDATKHKVMGVSSKFMYYKYIKDYFIKDDLSIQILAYSKPIWQQIDVASYLTKGLSEKEIKQAVVKSNKYFYNLYTNNGKRKVIPDIYYKCYDVYYLPKTEYDAEKTRLYELGVKESQNFTMKNFEDAQYYNYYYGKGNPDGFKYNEDIIANGYKLMKTIEEKVIYLNMYYYSSNALNFQKEIFDSANDFYSLLYAYNAMETNDLKKEMQDKLANLADNFGKIKEYVTYFPNSPHKNSLDNKAYALCTKEKPDKLYKLAYIAPNVNDYLTVFPSGKYADEAKEQSKKIQEALDAKIEADRQAELKRLEEARKARQKKIDEEGPYGVYDKYCTKSYGIKGFLSPLIKFLGADNGITRCSVEYNDSTEGVYYYDGRYFTEYGLLGVNRLYYDSEEDVQRSVYSYIHTGKFTREGALLGDGKSAVSTRARANNMEAPNYKADNWEYYEDKGFFSTNLGQCRFAYPKVNGRSVGRIDYAEDKKVYFVSVAGLGRRFYNSEGDAVRALIAYKRLRVLPTRGMVN